MGPLNMYAMTTKEWFWQDVDFRPRVATDFHYWRNHQNLNEWMQRLYYEKRGQYPFRGVPVALKRPDLERLSQDIQNDELPKKQLDFSIGDFEDIDEHDHSFVSCAFELLKKDQTVYFISW